MASFFQDLFESIFTPGPTPTLLVATNVTFAALQVVLAVMLFATYSVHFIVLSGLCGGLWWSINWFARELREQQQREEAEKARPGHMAPPAVTSEESETEVEGSRPAVRRAKAPPVKAATATASTGESKEVEVAEAAGEVKHRAAAVAAAAESSSQGTKSSVSTEDEWEKVSENEKDK